MKKLRKILGIAMALALILALFAACATNGNGDENNQQATTPGDDTTQNNDPPVNGALSSQHGGVLRVVTTAEGAGPIGLPWEVTANDIWLTFPMMEGLFREFQDGTVEGVLAESWEVDQENMRLNVNLRQGVRFHDGTSFNAEVAAWNLGMALEYAAPMANFSQVDVVGDYEISIHLGAITNSTVGSFTGVMYSMISMEAYLANGTEWAENNPIGTGPFVFVEYVTGSHLITRRNDDYWNGDLPYLDGLEIRLISDVMTQTLALQGDGEATIDVLTTHSGEQVMQFTDLGYQIILSSAQSMTLIPSSEGTDSPLTNRYVRLALSYAIDRDAIVAARGMGLWQTTYQYTVPTRPSWVNDPDYGVPSFNPERAREMLALGGFPDGFSTTLIAQTGLTDRDSVVAMQSMLADVGITASVEFPEAGGLSTMRANGWEGIFVHDIRSLTHMEVSTWLLFGDALNFFYSLRHTPELQVLVDAANIVGDNRAELIAISDYMLDDALIIPLWYLNSATILRPNVRGWNEDGDMVDYAQVWIDN